MERYKQECQKISQQINPSDEFMENLRNNLNKRLIEEKRNRKLCLSKVAMIFFTLTVISSGVFAKDIGNWLSQIFSNTDEAMMIAVENGYVQNVEMDYIEHQGIGIKVNSLIIDDNKMNIVFDVKGEIDGELLVDKIYLSTNENDFDKENLKLLSTSYNREFKSIDKKSHLLIIKISNIDYNLKRGENLNILLEDLFITDKNKDFIRINETWSCDILLEEDNFKDNETVAVKYIIKENEYIDNYDITTTNTATNIKIDFKSRFNKYSLINKEKIYIETEDGKKYLCREFLRTKNDMIQMNAPITIYDNIEKFDIILELGNEKIIFNVKKENS